MLVLEILLVFAVNSEPATISERTFQSYDACAEFVNDVANQVVVNSDYGFRFIAPNGTLFDGQCIEKKEYVLKKGFKPLI